MGIQINGNTNNINAGIGSLSIEDLNELDIVGVATAANFKTGVSNLHSVGLTLSGGQIDVGSNIKIGTAGVITATSFVGSGANLTGITQTTINNNANNRLITGSGTANTLEGEANLTFDGDDLLIRSSTDGRRISFATDGTSHYMKYDDTLSGIMLNGYGGIAFETNGTNERLRIDSSGRVVIGHTSNIGIANHNGRFQLHGTDYDTATMSIVHNGTDSFGSFLFFASQRSGSPGGSTVLQNNDAVGTIRFHAGDGTDMASYCASIQVKIDGTPGSNDVPGRIMFSTTADGAASPTERLRIASNGAVSINYAGTGDNNLHIGCTSNASGLIIKAPGNHYANIDVDANRSGADNGICNVQGKWNGTAVATMSFTTGSDTTNKDDGYVKFYTRESGADLIEAARFAADNTFHLASTGSDDIVYSMQTGRAQHSNSQSKTYRITGLAWGQFTFSIAVSDGNYKRAHVVVKLGGSQWSTSNSAYVATVEINDASGVNVSFNKETTYYDVIIANAGNSNTLFGTWQLEGSNYSNLGKPTLTIS